LSGSHRKAPGSAGGYLQIFAGVLLVKSAIWMISLGSGTSGGVLAPLLMMGAALGGIESILFPNFGLGFWPLVSMGAILGGTMRSPFTGIVFAIELTHDINMLLPLLVACFIAHAFTVLTLNRSILTEKISRRGYHLSREYGLDPLEILIVRDVMRTNIIALPANGTLREAGELVLSRPMKGQHLYPVVDPGNGLLGAVTRKELFKLFELKPNLTTETRFSELVSTRPVVAFADEPLRVIVHRMAESGFTRLPVLDPQEERRLVGMISLNDLLLARIQNLEDERARETVLRVPFPFRFPQKAATASTLSESDPTD